MQKASKYKRRRWLLVIGFVLLAFVIYLWRDWNAMKKEDEKATGIYAYKGLRLNYILTPVYRKELSSPVADIFAISPQGSVLLKCDTELLEIEKEHDGLVASKIEIVSKAPDCFTFSEEGTLLAVSENYFGQMEDSDISKALPLPYRSMKLTSSHIPGKVYLYGGDDEEMHRLYSIDSSGQLKIIAQLPYPIVEVSDNANNIYAVSGNAVYRFSKGHTDLVFRLAPGEDSIISVAVSPDNNLLYYSTKSKLYALQGNVIVSILNNIGGRIILKNEDLYLWDKERFLLIRINDITNSLQKS